MSKECPSCHREFRYLLQCTDCRMMFCNRCADQKFALIPIQFSKYDPGPGFVSICPKCGGGYDVLVDDDDCEESTDDRDSASDRSGASDQEEASNESSYSSSDYSGSAGGDWGGGIVALVVIAICWFLASSKYEGYQEWTRARHTYQATADAERVRNTRAANAPTPTYTQPRNIRPFESTVFGTYNWDKDQSLAQSNKLETENQGPASSPEQSAVATPSPADPPTVQCILPTGDDALISRTECRDRFGVIFPGE